MFFNWTPVLAKMITVIFGIYFVLLECHTEKVLYLNLERPKVDYYEPAYFANMSMNSRRYNRSDSHYYTSLEFYLLKMDKHCTHSFNFYEIMSASNKRQVMELQYDLCDWMEKDHFFGATAREAWYKVPKAERPMPDFKCPIMPGKYSFKNVVVPVVKFPVSFTIQNGRICYTVLCLNKPVVKIHADFQLTHINAKKI